MFESLSPAKNKIEKAEKLLQSYAEGRESWPSSSFPLAAEFLSLKLLIPSQPEPEHHIWSQRSHPQEERDSQRTGRVRVARGACRAQGCGAGLCYKEVSLGNVRGGRCGSGTCFDQTDPSCALGQSPGAGSCPVCNCQPGPCTQVFTDPQGYSLRKKRRDYLFR